MLFRSGRTEQQPDHRSMGAPIDISADLESGGRAGQNEEQAEALDEDHGAVGPLECLRMGIDIMVINSVSPRNNGRRVIVGIVGQTFRPGVPPGVGWSKLMDSKSQYPFVLPRTWQKSAVSDNLTTDSVMNSLGR